MSKTSWEVKKRYNDKVYKRIGVALEKELVAQWEKAIEKEGISKSEFFRRAMKQYLEGKGGAE